MNGVNGNPNRTAYGGNQGSKIDRRDGFSVFLPSRPAGPSVTRRSCREPGPPFALSSLVPPVVVSPPFGPRAEGEWSDGKNDGTE